MLISNRQGIDPVAIAEIIDKVSHDHYCTDQHEDNITSEVERKTRNTVRVKVSARNSYGPGARLSASGRHGPWACWHAFRDVIRAILTEYPDATVRTGMITYKGLDSFEKSYPNTGHFTMGSVMRPVTMAELCDCR